MGQEELEAEITPAISSTIRRVGYMLSAVACSRHSQEVLEGLKTKGIAIRVASPKLVMEEAPESYKDVTQVQLLPAFCLAPALTVSTGGGHVPCGGDIEEDGQAAAHCGVFHYVARSRFLTHHAQVIKG